MSAASANLVMQERALPSRPARLGTRRRRPTRARFDGAGGLAAAKRPHSLDTDKYLQTTSQNLREWVNSQETEETLYRRQISLHSELLCTYHALWQGHHAKGNIPESLKWEKKWLRLYNCRTEWVGYRADCCKSMTQPIAVPMGCNDRLCPLCAWDRSRIARKRVKNLFDRLTHPVMITLTIPNRASIRRHDFTLMRQRVRQFIAQHKAWVRGGVYSLETTYNRQDATWHIHAHILADVKAPLPPKSEKMTLADERVCMFTAIKLRLEFDWLRLWTAERGKRAKAGADPMRIAGDDFEFTEWVRAGRLNRLKEWRGSGYSPIDLPQEERARRTAWNQVNRRVVDVRPVTDRDGAAREVLKYITKVADFGDLAEAVEPFANAVKGLRLIQTFGTWYGVKLDAPLEAEHPESWTELKCACGCNMWRRMGIFYRRDVQMDAEGRWRLRQVHNWNSAGTVPRPTIRALEEREE